MSKCRVPISREEEEVLESVSLDSVEETDGSMVTSVATESEATEPSLLITDPKWHEFVMQHFVDDELNPDGKPLVHGLRRVTQLLLGPVLKSTVRVVQAPAFIPGSERLTLLQPAVVEYEVRILLSPPHSGYHKVYRVTVSDAADVYYGNTDPEFVRYATATATTRAEARCLRKLLRLRACAAEEVTDVPIEEAGVDGFITPTQVSFLNVLCRRCDINVMRYVNSGKKQYERAQDVPFGTAVKMVEHLSGYQTSPEKVPEELKGYDPNWLS